MKRALIIAPHADDETLGMGGTIAKKRQQGWDVTIAVMTGHGNGTHPIWPKETWDVVRAEAHQALEHLGSPSLHFSNLPAACLDQVPRHEINKEVASVIDSVAPHELYLPYYHDLHFDHELLCYSALVAARGYLNREHRTDMVAMYETPTETHLKPDSIAPAFVPNLYVDISAHLDAKIKAWAEYKSQHQQEFTPRNSETLRALARVRGADIGVEYAEGFVVTRLIQ